MPSGRQGRRSKRNRGCRAKRKSARANARVAPLPGPNASCTLSSRINSRSASSQSSSGRRVHHRGDGGRIANRPTQTRRIEHERSGKRARRRAMKTPATRHVREAVCARAAARAANSDRRSGWVRRPVRLATRTASSAATTCAQMPARRRKCTRRATRAGRFPYPTRSATSHGRALVVDRRFDLQFFDGAQDDAPRVDEPAARAHEIARKPRADRGGQTRPPRREGRQGVSPPPGSFAMVSADRQFRRRRRGEAVRPTESSRSAACRGCRD